jgi:hypothetical protein
MDVFWHLFVWMKHSKRLATMNSLRDSSIFDMKEPLYLCRKHLPNMCSFSNVLPNRIYFSTRSITTMSAPKSWLEMSKEAIVALKDRTGSSMQAIKAYIMKAYPTVNFQQHMLRQALKKGAESGKVRIHTHSFFLYMD